jgi:hypothetical protein
MKLVSATCKLRDPSCSIELSSLGAPILVLPTTAIPSWGLMAHDEFVFLRRTAETQIDPGDRVVDMGPLAGARRDTSGKVTHRGTWIIGDNGRDVSKGCAADEVAAAEQKLKDYIASKYSPKRKAQDIEAIPMAGRCGGVRRDLSASRDTV